MKSQDTSTAIQALQDRLFHVAHVPRVPLTVIATFIDFALGHCDLLPEPQLDARQTGTSA